MRSAAMDEFVNRVRDGSDIVSVVSSYVPLKRKGRNLWGCCPFHQEKTPSFSVVPDEGFFYCFGCHVGGNVFKFLSLIENISYFDAIKMQAEKLGIPLPKRERSPEETAREKKESALLKVMEMARDFFHSCLVNTRYGAGGLKYFSSRGIGDEVIGAFKLGFSPDAYEKLLRAFGRRGVSAELLAESGLAVRRDDGGFYDRFRGRVMIPITDERGRVVGFGGRVTGDGQPKYLNSPETMIFNKRRLLFGLDRAKKSIRNQGRAIITEGYMDAISLAASGIENAVASLGTAFTVEQCRLISRYAGEIYFCYDSDEAGQKATLRALSAIKGTGVSARALIVPDGKDPDEFVRKHGADAFRSLIESAMPVTDFQTRYVLKRADTRTPEGKSRALRALLPALYAVSDAVERNEHIAKISGAIGVEEGIIRQELAGYRGEPDMYRRPQTVSRPVKKMENAVIKAARTIVRLAWSDAGTLVPLAAEIPLDSFPSPAHGEILRYISACSSEGRDPGDSDAMRALSDEATEELSRSLVEETGEKDIVEIYDDCVSVVKKAYMQSLYEESRMKAAAMEREGNPNFWQELKKSQRIKQDIDNISQG